MRINKMISIEPVFKSNYCAVAFAVNNYYVPYLATTLKSLILNSNGAHNYDILVFSKDLSAQNMDLLRSMTTTDNISIRFIDLQKIFTSKVHLTAGHITEETYFRLIMPKIMEKYNRFLYMDADLIILDDIFELYSMDMHNAPLAATEECLFSALINLCDVQEREYFTDKLGIKNLDTYFQAGVLLFDVRQYNANNMSEKLMQRAHSYNYHMMDQDILNEEFNKSYIRFDVDWNYAPLQGHMIEKNYLDKMTPYIRGIYTSVVKPRVIHYADRRKPWLFPNEAMAEIWWSYARQTPFYEELLIRLMEEANIQKSGDSQMLHIMHVMNHMTKFKLKRFFYRNMKHIFGGNAHKKYADKYQKYNTEIKLVQNFLNNM